MEPRLGTNKSDQFNLVSRTGREKPLDTWISVSLESDPQIWGEGQNYSRLDCQEQGQGTLKAFRKTGHKSSDAWTRCPHNAHPAGVATEGPAKAWL